MKKAKIIVAFAVGVCLLCGCDFFRVLAGRPTSREIETKRKLIGLDSEGHLLQEDSTLSLQAQLPDTLSEAAAAQPTLEQLLKIDPQEPQPKVAVNTRRADEFSIVPDYRYYVAVGTFGNRDNANRQGGKAGAAGYPVELLPLKDGKTIVAVCGSNDLSAAKAWLVHLRTEAFCPKDAWVLNVE